MNETNTITLVVVCDDHYVIMLAALIKSVEDNLATGGKIDLWIVTDGITTENKNRISFSVNPAITSLYWKDFSEITRDTRLPKDRSSYPLNIYARLFIPEFMPVETNKALYLDVDMIVLTDLLQLWQTDITEYYAAAVQDPRVHTFDNTWGGIKNYKQLGLNAHSKYFNTGLLLINTQRWRSGNITTKVFETIAGNLRYANYPDQYGLNIVLAEKWLELDSRWNTFVTDETNGPYIIHFVGRKPFYKAYKYSSAYRDLFYKFLKDTAWEKARPTGEYERGVKKIKNIIAKIKQLISGKR